MLKPDPEEPEPEPEEDPQPEPVQEEDLSFPDIGRCLQRARAFAVKKNLLQLLSEVTVAMMTLQESEVLASKKQPTLMDFF